jgi:hypothetical protein
VQNGPETSQYTNQTRCLCFFCHRVNQFRALLAATDNLADAATAAAIDSPSAHSHRLSQVFSGASSAGGGGAVGAGRSHPSQPGGRHSYPGTLPTHHSDSTSSTSSSSEEREQHHQAAQEPAAADGVGAAAVGLQRLTVTTAASAGKAAAAAAGTGQGSAAEQVSGALRDAADGASSNPSRSSSPFAGSAGMAAAEGAASRKDSNAGGSSSSWHGAIQGPLELLGELMLQAHASYSTCGLGSDGTNRLVNIVRQHMMSARRAGVLPALYGAKITGGGSGGTVCVLGLSGPAGQAAIDAVVAQYREETGYQPFVFAGSSMGAVAFGHLRVKLRQE